VIHRSLAEPSRKRLDGVASVKVRLRIKTEHYTAKEFLFIGYGLPPFLSRDMRLNYPLADPLRDLRDDGVSESSKSVHPSGYPMSHSTHAGFNCPVITFTPWNCRPALRFAVGVGIVVAI